MGRVNGIRLGREEFEFSSFFAENPMLVDKLLRTEWDVEIDDSLRHDALPETIVNALKNYSFGEESEGKRLLLESLPEMKRAAFLAYHASNFPWTFYKGSRRIRVQRWINKRSPDYDALFLEICNPYKQMPVFRGTPIFYVEGINGTPGEFKSKCVDKRNDSIAKFHNLRNALKTHIYWGGATVCPKYELR